MAIADQPISKSDFRAELQHYATKADLYQMESRLIKWMIGVMFGSAALASLVITLIDRFLLT